MDNFEVPNINKVKNSPKKAPKPDYTGIWIDTGDENQGKSAYKRLKDAKKHKESESGEMDDNALMMKLEAAEEEPEMLNRLRSILKLKKEGTLSLQTEVSGETYSLDIVTFFKEGEVINDEKLEASMEKKGFELTEISVKVILGQIKGRQESLNLDYKISAESLLRGGGSPEENLKLLITGAFAGTRQNKIREKQEQELEKSVEMEGVNEIRNKLVEKKVIFLEREDTEQKDTSYLFGILTNNPRRKIEISTSNGEVWRIETVENDRNTDIGNLKPQEVMSKLNELI